MAVTETAQRPSDLKPVYREIASDSPTSRVLGNVSDVGLCPDCGAERLSTGNENAMPLFIAGAALGVMSIPFMLVTFVGIVALVASIPMMLAPLLMGKQSVCPNCSTK